jgi:hypothetical protein
MASSTRPQRNFLTIVCLLVFICLLGVIAFQQFQIRDLRITHKETAAPAENTRTTTRSGPRQGDETDATAATRPLRREEDRQAQARQEKLDEVEKELKEISEPLAEDMASTMFNADVKTGQSVVTGGYQAADGKNRFTILKPIMIQSADGRQQIQISSKMIAVSSEDTTSTGLNTLATNAKNTLQHAETWEEADVSSTMEKIRSSQSSNFMAAPNVIVNPGEKFSMKMFRDSERTYTLEGTAEVSPNGSGVVLKARIEEK